MQGGDLTEEEKILDKLKEEYDIENIIKFDNSNVQEELTKNPYFIIKFKDLFLKEEAVYNDLLDKYDKLVGKQYDFYRFEYDKNITKTEIEKYYIVKDPKIIKMKEILRKQKVRVDFFDLCYKAFEKRQWSMKTFCDNLRYGGI